MRFNYRVVNVFTQAAGHPTLGSAHVLRSCRGIGHAVTLEMKAGTIPVRADGDHGELRANPARSSKSVAATSSSETSAVADCHRALQAIS
jgi:predicted PhzF superfamily epimerase YddE/YHI9